MPTFHIYTYWVLKHCLYLSTCYRSRAQELEDEQERIDRELRKLLDKPGEITVESLEFVVVQFLWISMFTIPNEFISKTNIIDGNRIKWIFKMGPIHENWPPLFFLIAQYLRFIGWRQRCGELGGAPTKEITPDESDVRVTEIKHRTVTSGQFAVDFGCYETTAFRNGNCQGNRKIVIEVSVGWRAVAGRQC